MSAPPMDYVEFSVSDCVVEIRLVLRFPLSVTAGPPALPMVSDLLMVSGEASVICPETENLIVSLLAALTIA